MGKDQPKLSALRPNNINEFPSLNDSEEKKEEAKIDPETQSLAMISRTEGWRVIDNFIQELEDKLEALVTTAMGNGATFEEIGQKALVSRLAKDCLEEVRERVKNAREEVDNGRPE